MGEKAWRLLDPRLIESIDTLRRLLGKSITVNSWMWAGPGGNTQRGFREPSSSVGAQYSQHRFGRAVDLDVKGMTAQEVRDFIVEHEDELPYITWMEAGVSWVHLDVRNINEKSRDEAGGIRFFGA